MGHWRTVICLEVALIELSETKKGLLQPICDASFKKLGDAHNGAAK